MLRLLCVGLIPEEPRTTHRMVLLHAAPHLLPHLRGCLGICLPQLQYHSVYMAFGGLQQVFHGGPKVIRFGEIQNKNNRKCPKETTTAWKSRFPILAVVRSGCTETYARLWKKDPVYPYSKTGMRARGSCSLMYADALPYWNSVPQQNPIHFRQRRWKQVGSTMPCLDLISPCAPEQERKPQHQWQQQHNISKRQWRRWRASLGNHRLT